MSTLMLDFFFLFERVDAHGILNLNAHWCHHDRFEFCLTSPESLMLLSSVASVFSSLVFIFFGAMLHMSWKSSELQPRNHVPRSSSCGNQWKLSQFRLSTLLDSFLGHRGVVTHPRPQRVRRDTHPRCGPGQPAEGVATPLMNSHVHVRAKTEKLTLPSPNMIFRDRGC